MDLLVISRNFLIGLVFVSLALWAVAVCRGVRHHRVSSLTVALLAFVFSLATTADFVNAHYAFLPRVADVLGLKSWPTARLADISLTHHSSRPSHPRGAVVGVWLPGRTSGFGGHEALIYFPPQYFEQPTQRFPVVYLLHGSPGAPIDWFRAARAADAGLAVARAGHPVILVAPRASRNWFDDSECVDRPGEHIATYLVNDVVRQVDKLFRTIQNRTGRTLAGNSAGGYCALNLGLRHRDIFSTIIDMSGFDRPTYDGGLKRLFGNRPDFATVAAANTPRLYVPALSPSPPMRFWLDVGRGDRSARRDTVNIADALAERGFSVVLRQRPGGHNYSVWRPALRDGLEWAAGILPPR